MPTRVTSVSLSGQKPYLRPHKPWMAHYAFTFTPQPPADWEEIFKRLAFDSIGLYSWERGAYFCYVEPDRLQFTVWEFNRLSALADAYAADLESHPEKVREFELEAERACERLVFTDE